MTVTHCFVPSFSEKKALTVVPGVYTTYEIPLTDFGNNPADIAELVLQNYGTANITVYVDEVGFY